MCTAKAVQISKTLSAILLSVAVIQVTNCADIRSEIDRMRLDKASAAKSSAEIKADLAREVMRLDAEISGLKAKQVENAAGVLRFAETMVRVRKRVGAVEADIAAAKVALAAGLAESKANHVLLAERMAAIEEYRTQQATGEAKFSSTLLRARTTTSAIVELARGVTSMSDTVESHRELAESCRELHETSMRELGQRIIALEKHAGMAPKSRPAAAASGAVIWDGRGYGPNSR